jgi:hypothetical protein
MLKLLTSTLLGAAFADFIAFFSEKVVFFALPCAPNLCRRPHGHIPETGCAVRSMKKCSPGSKPSPSPWMNPD